MRTQDQDKIEACLAILKEYSSDDKTWLTRKRANLLIEKSKEVPAETTETYVSDIKLHEAAKPTNFMKAIADFLSTGKVYGVDNRLEIYLFFRASGTGTEKATSLRTALAQAIYLCGNDGSPIYRKAAEIYKENLPLEEKQKTKTDVFSGYLGKG